MKSVIDSFIRRSAKRKTLRSLQTLDSHLLRDIGLTHADLALMLRGEAR